ncbi:MAG: cytochrome c biogenesis protein CcdA [Cellulosilyticaceae bacterium]
MENLSFFVVFVEGILSFISPCILPILPVYLTILSNSRIESLERGDRGLNRGTLFKNTLLFILGISTTFFILGASMSVLNKFLLHNKSLLLAIGGMLIILMGLFYMGLLNIPFLGQEKKFHMQVKEMKPWTAYLLGFTFSFGWTPCIGPMLASVLLMAGSSESMLTGNLLIATYSLGFMIPFIVLAAFYKKLFKWVDKAKQHMGTIQKIGGILLIISGIVMIVSGTSNRSASNIGEVNTPSTTSHTNQNQSEVEEENIPAPDFTLMDQYGNAHTLSAYKGKTVFLNFWATWCPPCKAEMPYIEELYYEYGENEGDVVILGVAMPKMGREGTREEIMKFLEENKYTFPVVFDESEFHDIAYQYYINAFPTTFIINKEGHVEGYMPGGMNKEMMQQIIEGAR